MILFNLTFCAGGAEGLQPDKNAGTNPAAHYSMKQYTSNFLQQYFFVIRPAPRR
jgi:hypothetical protein